MKINEAAEAVLEELWIQSIHLIKNEGLKKDLYNKTVVKELKNLKLIELDGDKIHLTPEGFKESRKIIEARRLSEKILHNILGVDKEFMENEVHNFEPIIKSIVEGCNCTSSNDNSQSSCECCGGSCECSAKIKKVIEKSVLPLTQVKKGQFCKVVYIKSEKYENLHRILSIGVLPGRDVKIVQTHPSHIFQIENHQITVDCEIVDKYICKSLDQ